MKTFLARQPLFNRDIKVIGYELLFRSNMDNKACVTDGYAATLKVIKDLLVNFGLTQIAGSNRCFINFNEKLILQKAPDLFKPEMIVIEMLEDTMAKKDILEELKEYKSKGYLIALDDFKYDESIMELIELADIIKIDFFECEMSEIEHLVEVLSPYNKILLAEKVETQEEFEFAKGLEFSYFQGYFFQKPVVLETTEVQSIPAVYTELVNELGKTEVDMKIISTIIKKDTKLALSFLKLVNSVAYYANSRINSLDQAVIRLGLKESNKIILMNLLKSITVPGTPTELINLSLKRGKQAEILAVHMELGNRESELFILGLFSLINIIMCQDMASILEQIPIEEEIIQALLGRRNKLSEVLEIIVLNERGYVNEMLEKMEKYRLDFNLMNSIYLEATAWADIITTDALAL